MGEIDIQKQQRSSFLEYAFKKNKIVVLVDPQVGKGRGRGQLRALPFIRELGIDNFTFVDTWSMYRLVNFKYLKFGDELVKDMVFPLCQFISEEIENMSDLNITENLLNSVLANSEFKLVLVVDSSSFCLKNNQDGKPMIEDWDLSDSTFDYDFIFSDYLKSINICKPAIPFSQTRNLIFHEMAQNHLNVLGEKPNRLASLFDYENIPTKSYAWKILRSFANIKTQNECHPYVHKSLRSWVETDSTRITDNIMDALQRCNFDPKKVERLRRRYSLG
jgi:hypothetical protein